MSSSGHSLQASTESRLAISPTLWADTSPKAWRVLLTSSARMRLPSQVVLRDIGKSFPPIASSKDQREQATQGWPQHTVSS